MHPLGSCGEQSKSLTRPETVGGAPVGNVRGELLHVLVESLHVAFPLKGALVGLNVLQNNASPLGVVNLFVDLLNNISSVVLLNVNISDILNILCELLVSLVISVI